MRGEVYGGDEFRQKISRLISRETKLAVYGGDRKSEAYKDQAGCTPDCLFFQLIWCEHTVTH